MCANHGHRSWKKELAWTQVRESQPCSKFSPVCHLNLFRPFTLLRLLHFCCLSNSNFGLVRVVMSGLLCLVQAVEASEALERVSVKASSRSEKPLRTSPPARNPSEEGNTSLASARSAVVSEGAQVSPVPRSATVKKLRDGGPSAGFPCTQCGRLFSKKWNALVHQRVHSKGLFDRSCRVLSRPVASYWR